MSKIIAITNQKGGTGKTTTAVHFAHWLSLKGTVLVVDTDSQKSTTKWLSESNLENQIIIDPDEIFETLPELKQKYDFIIVDGPANVRETTRIILTRADIVLIPCRPAGLDVHSSSEVIRLVRQARDLRNGEPKAAVFLNLAKKNTMLLREVQDFLSKLDIPLLDTVIYNRQIITEAPSQNQVVWQMTRSSAKKAAKDFDSLFNEAWTKLNGSK